MLSSVVQFSISNVNNILMKHMDFLQLAYNPDAMCYNVMSSGMMGSLTKLESFYSEANLHSSNSMRVPLSLPSYLCG